MMEFFIIFEFSYEKYHIFLYDMFTAQLTPLVIVNLTIKNTNSGAAPNNGLPDWSKIVRADRSLSDEQFNPLTDFL